MRFFNRQGLGLLLVAVLVVGVCVSNVAAQGKTGATTFTDNRDGKVYKAVKMPDGKTWMAQNMNHKTGNSWCYDGKDANCKKYGRLYNWTTANTVCPAGWHLPLREEWDSLMQVVGGIDVAGKALKSVAGWDKNGNGTDSYGFSALPGGSRFTEGGESGFSNAGSLGFWWLGDRVTSWYMRYDDDNVYVDNTDMDNAFSVRCVGD
jgi:uncharacterized protein (TIGR02145 family)